MLKPHFPCFSQFHLLFFLFLLLLLFSFFCNLVLPNFLAVSSFIGLFNIWILIFPLLQLIDDQLSMLCRAITWNDIVLGSNRKGEKLSGGSLAKGIYLKSIIKGEFYEWQLLAGNYQRLLSGEEDINLRGKCQGGNYPGGQLSEWQLYEEQLSEGKVLVAIIRGVNFLFPDTRTLIFFILDLYLYSIY